MQHIKSLTFQCRADEQTTRPAAAILSFDIDMSGDHACNLRHGHHTLRVWLRALLEKFQLFRPSQDGHVTVRLVGLEQLRKTHKRLCELAAAGSAGWVPVRKAGKGPTELSCKVSVSRVIYREVTGQYSYEVEEKAHTLTVPVSLLRIEASQTYAPRWLLMKSIRARILKGKAWPHDISGAVFLEEQRLWDEVFAPAAEAIEADIARLAEEQAALSVKRKEQAEEERKREEIAKVARAKEIEERRRAAERAQARKEQLETLEVQYVEWDEWTETKNRYGSKTRSKITCSASPCTLRFSGQRVYLQMADGSEVIKIRKNVRWEGQGEHAGS